MAHIIRHTGLSFAPDLSRKQKLLLGLCTLLSTISVFVFISLRTPVELDADARAASRHMLACMEAIKTFRTQSHITIDATLDPALSGLIGIDYSDITTTIGDLRAKQTALQPQFAALLVMWLKEARVQKGDTVAISFSGSFPALNIAVHVACDVLELKPFIISSVGASTYGANIQNFTWLEMEAYLYEHALIQNKSQYASLGGILDTGGGIDETGIMSAEQSIKQHGAHYLREGTPRHVRRDVQRRMALYTKDSLPAAFINVGGNVTSLGWVAESAFLGNGLIQTVPSSTSEQRGTIFRMFELAVPVIHLLNIERLAAENAMPIAPVKLDAEYDFKQGQKDTVRTLFFLLALWFTGALWILFKL